MQGLADRSEKQWQLSGLSSWIMARCMQVRKHDLRLRMDAAIGRAPPLSDFELQVDPLLQSYE